MGIENRVLAKAYGSGNDGFVFLTIRVDINVRDDFRTLGEQFA